MRNVKIGLLAILITMTGLLHSKDIYSQHLKWTFEFNLGYNLIVPYSKIFYEADSFYFNTRYLNFPFGIKFTATTTPILLMDLGVNYEPRTFVRKMSFGGKNEDLKILFHMIKIPLNLRFNIPYDMFISLGFSLNFVAAYGFSGQVVTYSENPNPTGLPDPTEPPDPNDLTETDLDDPYYVGDDDLFRTLFNRSDYTINVGFGWKYNINNRLYTIAWLQLEMSIVDIDKSQYYQTYTFSIVVSGTLGVNI